MLIHPGVGLVKPRTRGVLRARYPVGATKALCPPDSMTRSVFRVRSDAMEDFSNIPGGVVSRVSSAAGREEGFWK